MATAKNTNVLCIVSGHLAVQFVYIYYPYTGKVCAWLCIVLSRPYALYVRGEKFGDGLSNERVLKHARFALTVSPSFIPHLSKFIPQVETISPMIDLSLSDCEMKPRRHSTSTKKFLFVGRVEEDKGVLDILQVALILSRSQIKFQFDIVGGGNLFNHLSQQIDHYKLNNQVKMHGSISEKSQLMNFYRTADFFFFPSHHEGFPRVLYEAMSVGLPIFTTFVGGIPGRMIHLQNCFQIPVRDPESAVEVVLSFCDNADTV